MTCRLTHDLDVTVPRSTEALLARYRIDLIDARGRSCFHAEIVEASDGGAVATAKRLYPDREVEIWEAGRLVWKGDTWPS